LEINSTANFTGNGKPLNALNKQKWYLTNKGKTLVIEQNTASNGEKHKMKLIFDKTAQR